MPTVRNVVRYDDAGGRAWDLVLGETHFEALSVHPADVDRRRAGRTRNPAVGDGPARTARTGGVAAAAHRGHHLSSIRRRTTSPATRPRCWTRSAPVMCSCPARSRPPHWPARPTCRAPSRPSCEQGPHAVVIKLAEAGCLVATREQSRTSFVPTEVVEPVDSTGAGDAFCGAFAAEHLRSGDVYAAAPGRRIGRADRRRCARHRRTAGRRHVGGGADDADHRDQPEHLRRADGRDHDGGGRGRRARGRGHRVSNPSGACRASKATPKRPSPPSVCSPRCVSTRPTPTPSSSRASGIPAWPPPGRSPRVRSLA